MSKSTAGAAIEQELKIILTNRKIPADLVIVYDDMHGLWGGATVIIYGSGQAERRERGRGASETKRVTSAIEIARLLEFIELLLKLAVWQQQVTPRQIIPDEVRATLTISVQGQASEIWELANDAGQEQRLPEIKARMLELMRLGQ